MRSSDPKEIVFLYPSDDLMSHSPLYLDALQKFAEDAMVEVTLHELRIEEMITLITGKRPAELDKIKIIVICGTLMSPQGEGVLSAAVNFCNDLKYIQGAGHICVVNITGNNHSCGDLAKELRRHFSVNDIQINANPDKDNEWDSIECAGGKLCFLQENRTLPEKLVEIIDAILARQQERRK